MTTNSAESVSRVTIVSSHRRVDLALPDSATLAELLPEIIDFGGVSTADLSGQVFDWVLQRFGKSPLDLTRPVQDLDIKDGEILYLNRRESAMPKAVFDDVVDAVATSTRSQPSWNPIHSKRAGLVILVTILLIIPVIGLGFGLAGNLYESYWMPLAASCLLGAGISLITAICLSRGLGEETVSTALCWVCATLSGIGGWLLLGPVAANSLRLVIASSLVCLVCVVGGLACSVNQLPLATCATSCILILLASSATVLFSAQAGTIGGISGIVGLFLIPVLPWLSIKLANIALPVLPASPSELAADITPVQSDITSRAILAERILISGLTSCSILASLSSLVLLADFSPKYFAASCFSTGLATCIGLALLLKARAFVGLGSKLVLLCGGSLVTVLALLNWLRFIHPVWGQVLVATVILLTAGICLCFYTVGQYHKVLFPAFGRIGDGLEWVALIGTIPLLLGVLGLYQLAGGLIS